MKDVVSKTILMTSFSTWKSSQPINSADQLLVEFLRVYRFSQTCSHRVYFLRQLPVNTPVATEMAIAQITQLNPQILLCCGMAETRTHLSLEAQAVVGHHTLHTVMSLQSLSQDLTHTEISYDAGRFVCNSFYYSMLNYLQNSQCACLFIHVPILTNRNRSQILMDFCKILDKCMV
jgi:pyroglutamyl-peptidase